jgi:predicted RNA binding protein YcfA (HicA-like mRNA interferase family)
MNFSKEVWDQLKNKCSQDLISALQRDGAMQDMCRGAVQVFRYPNGKRVTIHYHPKKTYGRKVLRTLLEDIGWTEDDLRRLKLVK